MSIADEGTVAFTTYTRAGAAKTTPVWIADLGDGTVGFTTPSRSWKARRLANDDRVVLQPSDRRGQVLPGSRPVTGRAVVSADDFARVDAAIAAKYGIQRRLIRAIGRVAALFGADRLADTAVVVTLDEG
ncbi:MAG: PPOX class F420-dependent oxidoreductase [Actinomyces sp.]|nr:MAG: PPOX class F420-dependent oxidoreductase [Actinomyces sp.]